MENRVLKKLYNCCYSRIKFPEQEHEIEQCHQMLIETLDKQERKLVLRIIDAKDQIISETSIDSFIAGFKLAHQIYTELNNYKDNM